MREFMEWAETATAEQRATAVRALARTYLEDGDERSEIEVALGMFLDDPSAEVRMALAEALADSTRMPRYMAVALAADLPDIAEYVLSCSPVFSERELTDIAAGALEGLQVAIALRPELSTAVSAAIAEMGGPIACSTLLANRGATIARISFMRIAERFGDDAAVREALLERRDLPPEAHQYLVRMVGDALGAMPLAMSQVPQERLQRLTRDACERGTIAIAAETETRELPALVEHLRVTGQLTTGLLLRAICAGNVTFFETALAVLARVPETRVQRLVRSGRLTGLRAIYASAGLPAGAFQAFGAALETLRDIAAEDREPDRYRATVRIVEAVLARYAEITDGEKNELVAMLRRLAAEQARDAARTYARARVAA
jgi:uncharacterized protein (DUF2336 family)